MNKIVSTLKEYGVFFIASVDGDTARVRPFGAVTEIDDKVYAVNANVEFDKILLLDYYCSERSEQIPIELKYLTASQKHIKEEFLLEHSLKKNECLRIIENKIYIFDYSEKNPVDERYNFTKL